MRRVAPACLTLLVATAVLVSRAGAGAPGDPWQNPISPDRPGVATPPTVVGPDVVQIETSFESAIAQPPSAPNTTTIDFPTLVRLGVSRTLELRLESPLFTHHEATTGFSDVSVEAKWNPIVHDAGAMPSIALMPAVSLPTGSSEFTADEALPSLAGLFGWNLRSGVSLTLDVGASRATDGEESFWELGGEGAFEIPLRRDWAVSGDAFVTDPLADGQPTPWGADAGVEFYPNPDTQLDLIASHTFTADISTSFQLGLSRRWSLGGASH